MNTIEHLEIPVGMVTANGNYLIPINMRLRYACYTGSYLRDSVFPGVASSVHVCLSTKDVVMGLSNDRIILSSFYWRAMGLTGFGLSEIQNDVYHDIRKNQYLIGVFYGGLPASRMNTNTAVHPYERILIGYEPME